MANLAIHRWERDFRAAAKNDRYDIFCDHLRLLELPSKPISMLKATIFMVYAMEAYYHIDDVLLMIFLRYRTIILPNQQMLLT
jgi:hypothetical protein